MTKTIKTFFSSAIVLMCVICAGACIIVKANPAAVQYYGLYILFLILAAAIGALVISFVVW